MRPNPAAAQLLITCAEPRHPVQASLFQEGPPLTEKVCAAERSPGVLDAVAPALLEERGSSWAAHPSSLIRCMGELPT